MRMLYIYVLRLEQNKYYVGKTSNPYVRLNDHFSYNTTAWTELYKPIEVLEIIPNCDDYDEDKYTRIYMDKYGIKNVRGGSFVSVKLDAATVNFLHQMHNGTNNKCFSCGQSGHFVNECRAKRQKVLHGLQNTYIPLSLISTHSPEVCQTMIKDIEVLQNLKNFKIKYCDIVLNNKSYSTLYDLIEDAENILESFDKTISSHPDHAYHQDHACHPDIKSYFDTYAQNIEAMNTLIQHCVSSIHEHCFKDISRLLFSLSPETYTKLQSGVTIESLEHSFINSSTCARM